MHGFSSDFEQFFLVQNNFVYLLTSVHIDVDDAYNYNRVIGIALLKAFSCNKNAFSHFFTLNFTPGTLDFHTSNYNL